MGTGAAAMQPHQRRGLTGAGRGLSPGVRQTNVRPPFLDRPNELGVRGFDGSRVITAVGRPVGDDERGQVLELIGGVVWLESDEGDPLVHDRRARVTVRRLTEGKEAARESCLARFLAGRAGSTKVVLVLLHLHMSEQGSRRAELAHGWRPRFECNLKFDKMLSRQHSDGSWGRARAPLQRLLHMV
eukprot:scaffold3837_cov110-Isochrysis_galbana.AAC.12